MTCTHILDREASGRVKPYGGRVHNVTLLSSLLSGLTEHHGSPQLELHTKGAWADFVIRSFSPCLHRVNMFLSDRLGHWYLCMHVDLESSLASWNPGHKVIELFQNETVTYTIIMRLCWSVFLIAKVVLTSNVDRLNGFYDAILYERTDWLQLHTE